MQQGGEGALVPHFGQEKVRKRFYETKARAAVSTEEETEHGAAAARQWSGSERRAALLHPGPRPL